MHSLQVVGRKYIIFASRVIEVDLSSIKTSIFN